MHKIIIQNTTFIFIIITSLLVNASESKDRIIGRYEAVSESEWSLTIDLRQDGSVLIEVSSWSPGKHENREIKKYDGKWSYDKDIISNLDKHC